MQSDCINLQERFGRRYRLGHDECYQPRRPDPWLLTVECRYGHIFPHGGNLLAASIDGFAKVASRLRRLKCCRVHQDGDFGELTTIFSAVDLPKVAKIIRPRGRRRLSARQRTELANRLRPVRKPTPQVPTGGQYTAQGSDPGPLDDSEAAEVQLALF